MYKIGDYVINATNGICQIKEIVEMDMSGGTKSYFFLVPVNEPTAKVYIPVDNADGRIRYVIDSDEAMAVINDMVSIPLLEVSSEKEREAIYKNAVKSCEPRQLVGLIKCIYTRREERFAVGKKCTAVDERYFKLAVNNLHSELAFALGRDKKEMEDFIFDIIENH